MYAWCDSQHMVGDNEGKVPTMKSGSQQMTTTVNDLEQPLRLQMQAVLPCPPHHTLHHHVGFVFAFLVFMLVLLNCLSDSSLLVIQ
jgi:hypothetical protein